MKLDLRKLTGRAKLIKNVSATNPPRGTKVAQQWEARRGTTKTINAYQVSGAGAGQIKIKIRRISENPDYTLLGHEDNVCALDAGPGIMRTMYARLMPGPAGVTSTAEAGTKHSSTCRLGRTGS